MGDPSNRNQSHLLQGRSTSRVLAPPGGHSSFNIGGYGGASEVSSNRSSRAPAASHRSTAAQPQRAPVAQPQRGAAPQQREQHQTREHPKPKESRTTNGRPGIPGLEAHYTGGGGSNAGGRDSNKKSPDYGDDNGSESRNRAYNDEDSYDQAPSPPKKLRTNNGSLSGGDYAAQLKAQINTKKNIDSDHDDNSYRPSGPRQEMSNNGSAPLNGSRNRTVADSRHDSAMQAYNNRQESDREKDYRRMQNMEERGSSQRSNDRNGDRNYDDRDNGASYKTNSANASNSAPVHTSTRVHAPPGGHSSFQIGWG